MKLALVSEFPSIPPAPDSRTYGARKFTRNFIQEGRRRPQERQSRIDGYHDAAFNSEGIVHPATN